ncbi:MAG TPA: serine/threonine-protein kinase, partial [Sphingomonadaceae bacterium]
AIKEYFPSSISERDEDATVVPIDSDAEEVHALGLKKFVEEAKLLWNLSTPTRHPNIVSVRSLFEIHGTAYMVMDFEDGTSLSKLLKSGKRWNEASLIQLIRPIAEGLERAHRVGVLHRDIKPPNILVNDDGRSVLIDFGSARFESGEATSTKVTFHTPPYAAIEQYVKTYEQGPWTDIYALGVVLYECITGEKPAEVLERMHGNAGKPLAEGNWPGYGKPFLAWVDAAMTIKPTERPQSIPQWLALLDQAEAQEAAGEEDRTTVSPMLSAAPEITPVAPPPRGFDKADKPATPVPSDPKDAKFKRVGEDTQATRKAKLPELAKEAPPPLLKTKAPHKPRDEEPAKPAAEPSPPEPAEPLLPAEKRRAEPKSKRPKKHRAPGEKGKGAGPLLIVGAAAAVLVVGGGAWFATHRSPAPEAAPAAEENAPVEPIAAAAPVDIAASGGLAQAVQALADDAAKAKAPAAAIKRAADAATQLQQLGTGLQAMAADPKQAAAVKAQQDRMAQLAQAAAADFTAIMLQSADGRVRRLAADVPWADPRNPNAAAGQGAAQQNTARTIRFALAGLRQDADAAKAAADPAAALTAARDTLAKSASYNAAIGRAYRAKPASAAAGAAPAAATSSASAPAAQVPAASGGQSGQASQLWPAKYRTFNSTVKSARDIADDVVRLGKGNEPGSDASKDEKDRWRIRQANVTTAQNYVKYLDTLTNSMRGNRSEDEVDKLISSADQTRRYLAQLKAGSQAANH